MKRFLAAFYAIVIAVLIPALAIPPHFASAASLYSTIQFRRGTAAQWTAADNVLASGEPGYETDTGNWKIGDGLTHWTTLKYQPYRFPTTIVGGLTGDGTGNISGFDNVTVTGNVTGDSTGNISGFDNATFTGRTTTATLTVTGVPTFTGAPVFTDNTINGADLIDNTVTNAKLLDNTIATGKIAATGTDNSTYLRRDGTWSLPSITTSTVILSSYKNLKITTPADNQSVTITADSVVTVDNTNTGRIVSTVSLTVNLDVAGANGLDNGTIAANTGYYLYVIDNGATTAGLASTSATAPTMPSGYTYKALVGWCTTDATTTPFNIEEFTQIDDEYIPTVNTVVVNNTSGGPTAVNLAAGGVAAYALVPPNITRTIRGSITQGSAGDTNLHPVTFSSGVQYAHLQAGGAGSAPFTLPLIESQTFYYINTGNCTVYLTGFTLKR